MKKVVSVVFCTLVLSSLLLLANMGTTLATEPGYGDIIEAYTTTAITLDGNWGATEWSDAWIESRLNRTARWAYKMNMAGENYLMSWAIDFHDTTNDANDRWLLCIDGSGDGGTAPNSNDHKIEIAGHSTLNVYQGTGTGWAAQTTTAVTWRNSSTTSPYDPVNHWVLEVQVNKGALGAWGANPPPHGLYIAMYDASNQSQGWISYPPNTPSDNPSRWGLIFTYQESVPEGLSLVVLVLLSSVAVLVGSFFVRKRLRVTNSPVATMH